MILTATSHILLPPKQCSFHKGKTLFSVLSSRKAYSLIRLSNGKPTDSLRPSCPLFTWGVDTDGGLGKTMTTRERRDGRRLKIFDGMLEFPYQGTASCCRLDIVDTTRRLRMSACSCAGCVSHKCVRFEKYAFVNGAFTSKSSQSQ